MNKLSDDIYKVLLGSISTSKVSDQLLKLFKKWALECVGEDEHDEIRMGTTYISPLLNDRNQMREEIRQRIEEACK